MKQTEAYSPQEDSYLMLSTVKKLAHGTVLEIGTGTGILAIAAAKNKRVESVTATDINENAIAIAAKNSKKEKAKIKLIHSNLFEKVPKKKFDTIIFNPPYLPQDKGIEDIAIYGGKKGHETIERFLNESSDYLSRDGKILLLFSSLTNKEKVDDIIRNNCYQFSVCSELPLFFEKLYCYVITKSPLLKEVGKKGITNVKKLATGHRGVIYTGLLNGKKVAIKSEKTGISAIGRIENEANWLKRLNRIGIGPKLLFDKKDYFAYEFIDGMFIEEFISKNSRKEVLAALIDVLMQCHELDKLSVNKEEMHHPQKHIIVTKQKTALIDFERCHIVKKPKNITQFLQFTTTKRMEKLLKEKGILLDPNRIRQISKAYRIDNDFDAVLKAFPI